MNKNKKVLFGGSLIIIAILTLLIAATPGSSGTELTLTQLLANEEKYSDKFVMTQGLLIEDSIDWNADNIELRFTVRDEDGNELPIFYQGVRPDNFSEDVTAIVEGYIQEDGVFFAEKLQTKCPSKYEDQDKSDYDPELHKKIENEE
ncbi:MULTISPECIES: cytochrome c maturation protein CcmE [Bacillaceae]|uniref:cytochrome c maturation protein CcmE n=1 Tax=Bacillaceae TaxID=186817 RepID=UPI001BDE5A55|nr:MULTISPECIES: cytochrome c maturation protein CcmE [Bacillaceae]MDX8359494.1 cytochrome c maturation protein CcmE [Cytobacillus sp. IB215316]